MRMCMDMGLSNNNNPQVMSIMRWCIMNAEWCSDTDESWEVVSHPQCLEGSFVCVWIWVMMHSWCFSQAPFFITKCVTKCKLNILHFCYICVLLIGGRNRTKSPPASCLVSLGHVDASSITAYYNVISDAPKQLDVYCAQSPWLITSQMAFPFNRVLNPTIPPHPQQWKTTKL